MKILKLEILGMVFISAFGSLLHFAFNWLNRFWLSGAFSAVNESTWEHLKLAVMAAIVWAVLESKVFKVKTPNFLFAKAVGAYLMPILIALFFYSYKAVLGHNLLAIDILMFVLVVIIGQVVSYKIMVLPEVSKKINTLSLLLLTILFLAFVVFIFYPPRFFLFKDPVSESYGITTKYIETGFGNTQVEKAIIDYLLTQGHFSWQTTEGSSNFCAIANLYPESELFPMYIWASCGEFILTNGGLKELSGMAAPVKINYPNELSFYDLNKFSFQAPGDGTSYQRDVKAIFPKEAQKRISNYISDKLGEKLKAIALSALKEAEEK